MVDISSITIPTTGEVLRLPPVKTHYAASLRCANPSPTINWEFLSKTRPFSSWFSDWENFMKIQLPTYPSLVKEFYEFMTHPTYEKDILYVRVKGHDITLTPQYLADLLRVKLEGSELRKEEDVQKINGFDHEYLTPANLDGPLIASTLTYQPTRQLHYIVSNYILPRHNPTDSLSKMELCVMWHIMENQKLNLPVLLLNHMKSPNAHLVYGSLISMIRRDKNIHIPEDTKFSSGTIIDEKLLYTLPYGQPHKALSDEQMFKLEEARASDNRQKKKQKISDASKS